MENGAFSENSLDRVGIFEDLFCISKRLKNRKIYLYGLNSDTKKALIFLAGLGLSIEGFLIGEEQEELSGIEYISRPVVDYDIIQQMNIYQECIILDIFGENLELLKCKYDIQAECLFRTDERKIVVYGAGICGRKLDTFFKRCNIKVDFYIDKKADEIELEGNKILGLENLPVIDKDSFMIIAINDVAVLKNVYELLVKYGFEKLSYFDYIFWDIRFTEIIWAKEKKEYLPVFRPSSLRYIHRTLLNERKVFLFSNNITYLKEVLTILNVIGIEIKYGVSEHVQTETENDGEIKICNAYDLLYENLSNCIIWALLGEEDNTRNFMRVSDISPEIFLYSSTGPLLLNRRYVLDTNIGYADSRGDIRVRNFEEGENAIKIAILGGSTSDYDLYYEKSWPEYFLNIAKQKGIKIECIVAATAGNLSSQEQTRLVRDVLWEKPDIVISYSRINETIHSVDNHAFVHAYQKSIFERLSKTKNTISFFDLDSNNDFLLGRENNDGASTWLANERIMYAICKEFGIEFFSIFQPCLYNKNPKELLDVELIEHMIDNQEKYIQITEKIESIILPEIKNYSWMYDFTNIFDGEKEEIYFDNCHLLGDKNRRLAELILRLLMESSEFFRNSNNGG